MLVPVVLQSCVDPILFETDLGERELVFYGNFTQLNENHIFTISRTSDFGKPVIPVTGASVVIKDDQGSCADYEEFESGRYELAADKIQGIPGRSYHIEITFTNGRVYYSTPQVMPEPIAVEEIYHTIESRQILSSSDILVDKTFIDVFIDTPLQNSSGETSRFRWTVDEVYSFTDIQCGLFDFAETCYFKDPPDVSEVLLFENKDRTQKYLRGFKVRSRFLVPFDEFTGRHYFIVNQYTISKEIFEYWDKINIVANQSGSLFDRQPARVSGNIFEKDNEQVLVLGYFEVNGQNVLRTFITPNQIKPFQSIFTCVDITFFIDHREECCNCSAKRGNQIGRPEYWDAD